MSTRPTPGQDAAIRALAAEVGVPPPPPRPVDGECCNRACDRCVWDYYTRSVMRWSERHTLTGRIDDLLVPDDT